MLPMGLFPIPLPIGIPTAEMTNPSGPEYLYENPVAPNVQAYVVETRLVDHKRDEPNEGPAIKTVLAGGQAAWLVMHDGMLQFTQDPPPEPMAGIESLMVQVTPVKKDRVRLELSQETCQYVKGTPRNRVIVARCMDAVKEVKLGKKVKVGLDKTNIKTAHRWVELTVTELPGLHVPGQVRAGIVPCPLPAPCPPPAPETYSLPAGGYGYYLPRPIPAARTEYLLTPNPICAVPPSMPVAPGIVFGDRDRHPAPICAAPPSMPVPCPPPPMPPAMVPCVAAEPAKPVVAPSVFQVVTAPSVIRVVTEEGQSRLEIQSGSGPVMSCENMVLKMTGGPITVTSAGTQVRIAGPSLKAAADKICTYPNDRMVLEGHVRFCQREDGHCTELMVADKVIVGLADGHLEIMKSSKAAE
jgi:hypothetical protein